MSINARLAATTLGHLAGLGVAEFVVCAGARNAPLVTLLLATCQEKKLKVYHHFDERSASFFALGLGKKSGRPVAVLTTSGTAVAELLPATIEAYYSCIPLILVTADRPPSFRGSGAPQAIEQPGIFGPYARVAVDVTTETDFDALSVWSRNEPLHLNLCFDEPAPEALCLEWEPVANSVPSTPEAGDVGEIASVFCALSDRLVVLLGELPPAWQPAVEEFLAGLGSPVWAEATSGLRESARLRGQIMRSETVISSLAPRQVLRIGGVPSLRFWRDLEKRLDIEVLSLTHRPFSGLARLNRHFVCDGFPVFSAERRSWVGDLNLISDAGLDDSLTKYSCSEPSMVRELSRHIPAAALVFLGNSLPVREWNLAASYANSHPRVYSSRGANGIDGQIATFLGLSDGEGEAWGIFGDLTALYDLNAPALLDQLTCGNRRLVIVNNGGGRIFSRLPSMSGLTESHKRVTENRHCRHFEKWAAMWDLGYVRWSAGDSFPVITGQTVVIEIIPDEAETELFWEARK